MQTDLVTLDLKLAMKEPGCPICRLRQKSEKRYLLGILRENVNDPATRAKISKSLGFCPKHGWQLQHMEEDIWHDGLGNAIIYQDLTRQVISWLDSYSTIQEQAQSDRLPKRIAGKVKRFFGRSSGGGEGVCPACAIGAQSEHTYLEWLVRWLPQPEFRELYESSDGLCLDHLRYALDIAEEEKPESVAILIASALKKLKALEEHLDGYIGKHSWHRHTEEMSRGELESWKKAVAFFSGEEDICRR